MDRELVVEDPAEAVVGTCTYAPDVPDGEEFPPLGE